MFPDEALLAAAKASVEMETSDGTILKVNYSSMNIVWSVHGKPHYRIFVQYGGNCDTGNQISP
jgi:hypothetical protein